MLTRSPENDGLQTASFQEPGFGNLFSQQSSKQRRSHTKSRIGCRSCKRRRIKCDERREGGCLKCDSRGIECDYLISHPQRKGILCSNNNTTSSRVPFQSPDRVASHGTPKIRQTNISPSVFIQFQLQLPISTAASKEMTDHLAIFHHFNSLTSYTCGSPQGQVIIQESVLGVAMQTPYLMHALLGVAASHMTFLLPAEVNAIQHAKHNLADLYHWGNALKLFRQELQSVGPQRQNMDALLSTIMLVAIDQFALKPHSGIPQASVCSGNRWRESFVFIDDQVLREDGMKWLSIQSGFKMLLSQLGRHLADSIWFPVFETATIHPDAEDGCRGKTWEDAGVPDDVESAFCRMCSVDEKSCIDNNPYYGSLQTLLHLRKLRPISTQDFNKMITFTGRISPRFRSLVLNRDPAALAILAHWLGLMTGIRQWWISDRVELECKAIITYLQEAHRNNAELVPLLREPAEAVGL